MRDEDRVEFANGLHVLAETFREPVSEIRSEGYWDALKDLHLESWQFAVRQALKSCRFFPKPVELREMVEGGVDTRVVPSAEETRLMLGRYEMREMTDTELAGHGAFMKQLRLIAGKCDMNKAIGEGEGE